MYCLVPSHHTTDRYRCAANSDSPATDRDARKQSGAHRHLRPTDGDANTDRHAHTTNSYPYPPDANPLASHRHRVRFRL